MLCSLLPVAQLIRAATALKAQGCKATSARSEHSMLRIRNAGERRFLGDSPALDSSSNFHLIFLFFINVKQSICTFVGKHKQTVYVTEFRNSIEDLSVPLVCCLMLICCTVGCIASLTSACRYQRQLVNKFGSHTRVQACKCYCKHNLLC